MERLVILFPTSHVDPTVEERLRSVIARTLPDVIAVELDEERYHALTTQSQVGVREMLRLGLFQAFFTLTGRAAQRAAARVTGYEAGSDMLTAIRLAEEAEARVLLADQPIRLTLARMRLIPFREKARLVLDLVLPWRIPRHVRQALPDILRAPRSEQVDLVVTFLTERYPVLSRVLLHERNAWMTRMLLSTPAQVILLVTGAAHVLGIARMLEQQGVRVEIMHA